MCLRHGHGLLDCGLSYGKYQLTSVNNILIVSARYPIAYCLIVMPLSVVRWIAFKQIATYGKSNISPVATFTVAVILGLSGVIDAVLYLLTRRWLFFPQRRDEPHAPGPVVHAEKSPSTSGSTSA